MPMKLEDVDQMVLTLKAEVAEYLPFEALTRFEICLSEALANLVIHADGSKSDMPSDVTLLISDLSVEVEIFDPIGTKPFDLVAKAVPLENVELLAEGGRGLGLILECADRVSYGPSEDRNRLWLRFCERNENQQTEKSGEAE